ncbi:hypothetical protein CORC01_06848 [Colletotrichum orchidophilum]|uniref:Condensation domain-containing protein n=1 Tax=Colletotrichum orchidophilum TaxID=1209926 RepID=A0A1G4B8Z2_9PEZI|nr:uncharacterized protein CORC01_06848 [Colletotrichum orchidophilum]OHE97813.1 hypothetical protein CORC01_06848 [Colletotrichum orchidophilum]
MEPPRFCVDPIVEAGKSRNMQVNLATRRSSLSSSLPWIRLHSLKPTQASESSLSAYYDFSDKKSSVTSLGPPCRKMHSILHVPTNEKVNAIRPLIKQGVDPLSAITIISWVSRTLLISIPLPRVVSGASIAKLAEEAARRLSRAAIPLIESANDIAKSEDNSPSGSHSPINTSIIFNKPTIFCNTLGLFMKGSLDLDRHEKALNKALRRHEIIRTVFLPEGEQVILATPVTRILYVEVSDRAAAEEAYKQLEKKEYDLAVDEGLKIINLGSSITQNFPLYIGAQLLAPQQYSSFASRQRSEVHGGQTDRHRHHVLDFYKQDRPGGPPNPIASQRLKAAMGEQPRRDTAPERDSGHPYPQAVQEAQGRDAYALLPDGLHLLLAQLLNTEDVAIVIADTNCVNVQDVYNMGFLVNLLPVRLAPPAPAQTFVNELEAVKKRLRKAMQHSNTRCRVDPTARRWFFTKIRASRERTPHTAHTPHDVVLEMSDDPAKEPAKEPLVTVKL